MPSTQVIGSIAEEIARELASRSHELTRRWHDELHARLAVRPQRDFSSELLIDHVPSVIRWAAAFLVDGSNAVPHEAITRLRGLVRLRREQGHRVEELLAELDLLGQILFDELREEISTREATLSASEATGLAQRLHRGLSAIATMIGGLYRADPPAEEVEEKDRGADFIRVLMHELRNPLSAAQAAAQVLEDLGERVSAERRRLMAARIRQRLRRANDLLDSVTSLSLVETEPIGSVERRAPLRQVIEHVMDDAGEFAGERDVKLEIESDVPDVIVDVNRCELVLYNLVRNAINYADPEKPTSWVRITVDRRPDGTCRIQVVDNGIGISEDDREHIFERFFRAPGGRAPGHGLGLAIARDAADQLGAQIDCESERGAGSTFALVLPA